MPEFPLTEGDVDRGRPAEGGGLDHYCGIVEPTTGAVCTKRPHGDHVEHQGYSAVSGGGRDRQLETWSGGEERALVVEQGYTWTRVPGTDVEVRVLANRPVALRYRQRTLKRPDFGSPQ